MCEPTTIALVIAGVGTAASLAQQDAAASAQERSNAVQRDNAIKARNENLTQIEVQKQQATTQAGQKVFENNLQAQKAEATAKVSAGENGVSGLSLDALLAEIDASSARYDDSVKSNLTDKVVSFDLQRDNVQTGAVNSVSNLKTPQAPDYLGAALKIGGAYSSYEQAKKK